MSHVASVECYVTDLEALEAAADGLGFTLVRNATTYAWYGRWMNDFNESHAAVTRGHDPKTFGTCVHKLRRKNHQAGDYEIGLVPRLDGKPGFELIYDNWGNGGRQVEALAGKNLSELKRQIAAEVSTRVMQRQGYRVSRTTVDGKIRLTATRS